MGWEALEQWGDDAVRSEPLTGGVGVNEVWSVRINGHLAVGRLGQRSDADLAWETDLLRHLYREGMPVQVPIPTTNGRHFVDGLVVMTYVEGGPPETEADWRRVADTLRQLHRFTHGWLQRPGWRSSTDLLHAETGTRVDLGAMLPEGVVRCRAAWARLTGRTTCVVHGDPNPRNIRVTADRVAMIDWDESHVDVPDLDLALPHNAAVLDDDAYDIAAQARAAWEAAVCWDPSDRPVRSQAARRSSSDLSSSERQPDRWPGGRPNAERQWRLAAPLAIKYSTIRQCRATSTRATSSDCHSGAKPYGKVQPADRSHRTRAGGVPACRACLLDQELTPGVRGLVGLSAGNELTGDVFVHVPPH